MPEELALFIGSLAGATAVENIGNSKFINKNELFVTGKNWPYIFQIKIIKWPCFQMIMIFLALITLMSAIKNLKIQKNL